MLATRRTFLASLLALGAGFESRPALATLARGLTVRELVAKSAQSVVATPLEAHCEWATFGSSEVIVTESSVRIEEAILGDAPGELLVRVLGGSIGEVGMRVSGQAELPIGKSCVLFLTAPESDRSFVVGAAQGHYPLVTAERSVRRLAASPHLGRLVRWDESAVRALRGRTLGEARELVRSAK